MATHRLGLIMHGVTGRMGYNQHLVRSILAIRQQGGVVLPNGDRVMPDPILVGRNAGKLEEIAARHGLDAHLDRPCRRSGQPRRQPVLRRRFDADAGRPVEIGDRGGQARLLRKADRRVGRRCAGGGAAGQGARRQERRRPGQALSARAAQARHAARFRLLRPHPVGARRVRLLGVRGRLAAGAAAELELPQGRRRRHHPRYAVPLALRARQSVRPREIGELPRRQPYSGARRRGRPALHGRRRRFRLRHVRARGRRRRPHQLVLVRARAAATISSPSRSTARTARRLPG